MKTRVIHTRFWKDDYISKLPRHEKLLFNYLLTNENVNMCGVYELPDKYICMDTDLNNKELQEAKAKFQNDEKFFFLNGWVKILNHDKYNVYGRGESQQKALTTELNRIPSFMLDTSVDTSVQTRVDTTPNTKTINHKSKILNPNVERVNLFLNKFNEVYQTKYISVKSFVKNFEYWNKEYTIEQICEAIEKSKLSDFWADKLTPEKMLRTNADRIGEFLNIKVKPIPPYSEIGGDEWIDDNADVYKFYKGKKVYANPAQPTSSQEQ